MTTPPLTPRPAQIARKLNALLAELIHTRGVPASAQFSEEHNAMIVHYETGPVVVHPMEIRSV